MNTRSNVLEEFNANGITYPVDTVDHMADEIVRLRDRIRELEARLAASDDGCMKCDGPFCGCVPAPVAAGVTVTEAMVDAVVRFLYRHFDIILNRDGATKMLTAALQNAASEGASAS